MHIEYNAILQIYQLVMIELDMILMISTGMMTTIKNLLFTIANVILISIGIGIEHGQQTYSNDFPFDIPASCTKKRIQIHNDIIIHTDLVLDLICIISSVV